jgi:hypothetical protein
VSTSREHNIDELSALGGSTRLVARKSRSSSQPKASPQPSSEAYAVSSPGSGVSSPRSQAEQVTTPAWPGFDLGQVQDFSGFSYFPMRTAPEPQQLGDLLPSYGGSEHSSPQLPMVPDTALGMLYDSKVLETMMTTGWTDERMGNDDLNASWRSFMAQFGNE